MSDTASAPGATPAQEAQELCEWQKTDDEGWLCVTHHRLQAVATAERPTAHCSNVQVRAQTADRPAALAEDADLIAEAREWAKNNAPDWLLPPDMEPSPLTTTILRVRALADALASRSAQVRAVQALPESFQVNADAYADASEGAPFEQRLVNAAAHAAWAQAASELRAALALNRGEPEANTDPVK